MVKINFVLLFAPTVWTWALIGASYLPDTAFALINRQKISQRFLNADNGLRSSSRLRAISQ